MTKNNATEPRLEFKRVVDLFKTEFERIKAEQSQRIGFRDNMIFVQFAAIGAICSFVAAHLDKPSWAPYALIVIPWVCVILGWTYVINDHAISQIGRYVRLMMNDRIKLLAELPPFTPEGAKDPIMDFFGWEEYHRIDKRRVTRKRLQFWIDVLTFVIPGVFAVGAFWLWWLTKGPHVWSLIPHIFAVISAFAIISLGALVYIIFDYADFGFGKKLGPG